MYQQGLGFVRLFLTYVRNRLHISTASLSRFRRRSRRRSYSRRGHPERCRDRRLDVSQMYQSEKQCLFRPRPRGVGTFASPQVRRTRQHCVIPPTTTKHQVDGPFSALGAGGRRFKSSHSDSTPKNRRHVDHCRDVHVAMRVDPPTIRRAESTMTIGHPFSKLRGRHARPVKETSDRAAVSAATRDALRNGACRTPK